MQTTTPERIADYVERGWWGDTTLLDLFDGSLQTQPRRLALVDPPNRDAMTDGRPRRLTFGDLGEIAESLAAILFANGIRKDDIVVLQLPNIAELPLLYFALARLGAVASPAPIQYGAHELTMLRDSLDPAAFISLTNISGQNPVEAHGAIFGSESKVFAFGDLALGSAIPLSLDVLPELPADYLAYRDGLSHSADDILTICWTSGTTGQPEGRGRAATTCGWPRRAQPMTWPRWRMARRS